MKELIKASNELNKKPLPAIKPASGLRIPQNSSSFLQANYRLKTDMVIFSLLFVSYLINYIYKYYFFYRKTEIL